MLKISKIAIFYIEKLASKLIIVFHFFFIYLFVKLKILDMYTRLFSTHERIDAAVHYASLETEYLHIKSFSQVQYVTREVNGNNREMLCCSFAF